MKTEILAPVGGKEQLIAAVRSGADAVYFGLSDFNARKNAENFDDMALIEAVSYCHARNVKVYITLNTIIKDSELPLLAENIKKISQVNVDAVIVQDLAAAALVKSICPKMPLHASTQMSIHNLSGVQFLEKLGFKRVVLSRELSKNEIEYIAKNTKIELEVFVHGALCMSVSGQCYLSSILGQRSGNRGLCAQPCRLNFVSGDRKNALSLKDLSLVERIPELEEIGVTSLKIEGRMKRPEYVAAAVTECKKSQKKEQVNTEKLKQIFSRSGFTSGYFDAKRNIDMFGYRTKEDVVSAKEVLGELAQSYRIEKEVTPVDMELFIEADKNSVLKLTDGKNTITVCGEVPQIAQNKPTTDEMAKAAMAKCGGTQYYLDKFTSHIESGLMMPVSQLNSLRKSGLDLLEKERSKRPQKEINEIQLDFDKNFDFSEFTDGFKNISAAEKISNIQVSESNSCGNMRIRLESMSQLTESMFELADKIILPINGVIKNAEILNTHSDKIIAELPLMMYDNEEKISEELEVLKDKAFKEVICGNLGGVYIAKKAGMIIHGDYALNVLNSISAEIYSSLGLSDLTLSFEINAEETNKKNISCGIISYGYLPLMTFRSCPAKTQNGCEDCKSDSVLTDRMDKSFNILCKGRRYSQFLNCVPLYMGDRAHILKRYDFHTLYFTKESKAKCMQIIKMFKDNSAYKGEMTRGLYFKELL